MCNTVGPTLYEAQGTIHAQSHVSLRCRDGAIRLSCIIAPVTQPEIGVHHGHIVKCVQKQDHARCEQAH